MFRSVLIANRGEIACRIIRTARRLGLRTIAVYSEADRCAAHVRQADEAHPIGPAPAAQSYLDAERIIAVAKATGAECVHPGYGFLAENAAFARACAEAGVAFVGPPPQAIRLMGLKHEAKALMERAGVPVAPGYGGERQDEQTLAREAARIGYPVMLKPVAGGGGKGMRRVASAEDLPAALESARREAKASFGDDRVLIEICLDRPRHIEVQVFADRYGSTVHLFERDCSLQRRHQKIIEEAPAPGMPEALRARMTEAAVAAAQAVGYIGAGTVEFLVEGNPLRDDSRFYFMEMNTRLQVEHPVTEAVTGVDLVEWQFRIAAGEPLPLAQQAIGLGGHAIEARLYAEDPEHGFLPSTGRIYALRWPQGEGLRIDSGIEEGDEVTPHYDPMLAKLIAVDADRPGALARLARALEHTLIAGPRTNLALLHAITQSASVARGAVDTELIDREGARLLPPRDETAAITAGALALLQRQRAAILARRKAFSNEPHSPWDAGDGFALGPPRRQSVTVLADGEPRGVELSWSGTADEEDQAASGFTVVAAGTGVLVLAQLRQIEVRFADLAAGAEHRSGAGGTVRAPMHGRITKVWVSKGQVVSKGDRLAVLEAMKMEHVLHAARDGRIAELNVSEGMQVERDAVVATIIDEGTA